MFEHTFGDRQGGTAASGQQTVIKFKKSTVFLSLLESSQDTFNTALLDVYFRPTLVGEEAAVRFYHDINVYDSVLPVWIGPPTIVVNRLKVRLVGRFAMADLEEASLVPRMSHQS